MKTIYKKYCNDIQNPALGAYLIYVFSNTFYQYTAKTVVFAMFLLGKVSAKC